MNILYKNNEGKFSDVDTKKGIITGYASVFGNVDSDKDIIKAGAYTKTIKDNGERIAFLYQHNIGKPIGKNQSLVEDSYGLKFEALFSKSQLGRDVAIMVDEGIIKEVSVGFQTIKGETKGENYEIQEIKLYEYSLVTLAANPMALVTGMKSAEDIKSASIEKIKALENYMKKGSVSDETFRMIEFQIANIKDIMTLEIKKPIKSLPIIEPSLDFNKLRTHLKN